jgi:DNA-binding response OmpR family regulator
VGYRDPMVALEDIRSDHDKYDIVISDIRMPLMNGYELAKEILQLNNQIILLIVTAVSNLKDIPGYDHNLPVLSKPFMINELLEFINKHNHMRVNILQNTISKQPMNVV